MHGTTLAYVRMEYDEIEYDGLPEDYSIFVIMLCSSRLRGC